MGQDDRLHRRTRLRSAGIEALYQRREQDWRHLLDLARQELSQTEQNRLATEVRAAVIAKDLDPHQTVMDQADELDEFHRDKFTGLGLYNYLATTLTRVYREAYHTAYDVASAAQRAYAYERDDDTVFDDTVFVAADNWAFDRAGLLAGERLLGQLNQMERRHLMTNNRRYEVTQAFSLAQLDASALVTLRETGECAISIPEFAYDLAYPGQYRRRITAVRVTIPCVVGPYTNVGAKLTLTASKVRMMPGTDPGGLTAVPPQATTSIATSNAAYDAGVFDLSLRDERYLPFEGAGAVSDWSLQLPKTLRPFDYRSISDVVLHVSYTALDDGALRDTVEGQIEDTLTTLASSSGLFRLFSPRHDFPTAATQLLAASAATQQTTIDLGPAHFPYLLRGRALTIAGVSLYLLSRDLSAPVDITGLALTLDGAAAGAWTVLPDTAVQHADVAVTGPALATHPLKVTGGKLDPDTLEDLLILVKYATS